LSNDILSLDHGEDSLHLNLGRGLETVSVYSSQEVVLEAHIVEFLNSDDLVGLLESLSLSLLLGLLYQVVHKLLAEGELLGTFLGDFVCG